MKKTIIYIDMDNVLVDFKSGLDKVPPEIIAQYEDDGTPSHASHYDDIPGIFSLMEPMDGAIEAIQELSSRYDLYILSTAPWDNPSAWADKLNWIKRYFGSDEKSIFYKRIILSHHKDLCIQPNAYLIDDRPNNGAERFGDRWLHFGTYGSFANWQELCNHLL